MNEIKYPKVMQYWCAYSDDLSAFLTGVTNTNQVTTTSQPNLESFDTEKELIARVDELKGEGYYQSQKEGLGFTEVEE